MSKQPPSHPEPESRNESQPGPGSRGRVAVWATLVGILGVLPFLPALRAGWVDWDDPLNFLNNPHYRGFGAENLRWMFSSFLAGHYIPITWLSAALDFKIGGMEASVYHRTNLILHGLNAGLVFLILLRLRFVWRNDTVPHTHRTSAADVRWVCGTVSFRDALLAAVGALFFAVHPLRVESVAWITERRDVLSSFFLLASLWVWLPKNPGDRRTGLHLSLAVLLYALSLFSKAMGITFPAVLLILMAWPLGELRFHRAARTEGLRALLRWSPFALLSAGVASLALFGQSAGTDELSTLDDFSLLQRLAQSAFGLLWYPWKTILPTDLCTLYELDRNLDPLAPRYLVPALASLALGAWLILRARRRPALLVAALIYAAIASPLLGVVQTGVQLVADRYSYLACLPFAALVSAGLARLVEGSPRLAKASIAISVALLAMLSTATWAQTKTWDNSLALWTQVVESQPTSLRGHQMLAINHHRLGDEESAIRVYREGLDLVGDRDPSSLHYNLAISLLAENRTDEALESVLAILDRDPIHPKALTMLRDVAARAGKPQLAQQRLEHALGIDATNAALWLELSRHHRGQGDLNEALRAAQGAIESAPEDGTGHAQFGLIYLHAQKWAEAEGALLVAVELTPTLADAWVNLGVAQNEQGRPEEARLSWFQALKVDPMHQAAMRYLSRVELRR